MKANWTHYYKISKQFIEVNLELHTLKFTQFMNLITLCNKHWNSNILVPVCVEWGNITERKNGAILT